MSERYPVPVSPPSYTSPPAKVNDGRRIGLFTVFDAVFIGISLILTFWYAGILLVQGVSWSLSRLLLLLVFWLFVTYLALPRVHQLFTLLYVPDYFIGRSRTVDGLLGDPVNLAVDGDELDIHASMQAAGWTLAEEITVRSAWGMVVSAVLGRSYPSAPVSGLYLFGKRHAFCYQQEVAGNPSQRHHVRFWPVPEGWALPGGAYVDWLAGGTYDRSVGLSAFTFQVTHKIDEDIDLERDYIINTVRYADPEVGIHVLEEYSTAYHSRNGGGDRIRTDGHLPVLEVEGAAQRHPGAVTPESRPAEHHLPPAQLVLAALLVVVHSIIFGVYWWQQGGAAQVMAEPHYPVSDSVLQVLLNVFGVAVVLIPVVLAILTILRHRWAKILLMFFMAVSSFLQLAEASVTAELTFTNILVTSFGVLVLFTLTGAPTREWVSHRRGGVIEKPEPTVQMGLTA